MEVAEFERASRPSPEIEAKRANRGIREDWTQVDAVSDPPFTAAESFLLADAGRLPFRGDEENLKAIEPSQAEVLERKDVVPAEVSVLWERFGANARVSSGCAEFDGRIRGGMELNVPRRVGIDGDRSLGSGAKRERKRDEKEERRV